MRRIAFLLLGLCLTVGMVGCKEDTATDDTTTPPATDGTGTAPADTDADTTEEAAEPAAP